MANKLRIRNKRRLQGQIKVIENVAEVVAEVAQDYNDDRYRKYESDLISMYRILNHVIDGLKMIESRL